MLGLPKLPRGKAWRLYASTDDQAKPEEESEEPLQKITIPPFVTAVEKRRTLGKKYKHHRIFHLLHAQSGDGLTCGYPDVSFHGREAWRPDTSPASRSMGVMFCG